MSQLARVTRALYDALQVAVHEGRGTIALTENVTTLLSPMAIKQGMDAIRAYDGLFPEGLLPRVDASDVLPFPAAPEGATTYVVLVDDLVVDVVIPADADDKEMVLIRDTAGADVIGIDLGPHDATVGHWPDDEEWVEVLTVKPRKTVEQVYAMLRDPDAVGTTGYRAAYDAVDDALRCLADNEHEDPLLMAVQAAEAVRDEAATVLRILKGEANQ